MLFTFVLSVIKFMDIIAINAEHGITLASLDCMGMYTSAKNVEKYNGDTQTSKETTFMKKYGQKMKTTNDLNYKCLDLTDVLF